MNYFYPQVSKATKAVWFLKSDDKRWKDSGAFIYRGMKGIPLECSDRIQELKDLHGELPGDLEWCYKFGFFRYYLTKFTRLCRLTKIKNMIVF